MKKLRRKRNGRGLGRGNEIQNVPTEMEDL